MFAAWLVGLALSFAVVGLLRPRLPAPWSWSARGVLLHVGLWLVMHASLAVVLGRVWFAMALGLAVLMLIVQVSNAKFHVLREPFVFQDFEYFTDALRHPRLYIPFLGWWKFGAISVVLVLALMIGLWLESPLPDARLLAFVVLIIGAALLLLGHRGARPCFEPVRDLSAQGLLASLWDYGWAERVPLKTMLAERRSLAVPAELPDMVVVQSESFFDARRLVSGVRQDVLANFDLARHEAMYSGTLEVPAWGANTVRSEFAFLSGLREALLGVHRFNPYRSLLVQPFDSLVSCLKRAGYRTVCVHPYPASFYNRHRVFPHLGFDAFIDIEAFAGAERMGPYVSDKAVTDKVIEILGEARQPIFVFVITMENHGPLHLERVQAADLKALYDTPPPDGCDDLSIYLRHLRHADEMIGRLRSVLSVHHRPARLCWYGDHVPIMPAVYNAFGVPDGQTDYFVWQNRQGPVRANRPRALHELAEDLLSAG